MRVLQEPAPFEPIELTEEDQAALCEGGEWERESAKLGEYVAPSPFERLDALPILQRRFLALVDRSCGGVVFDDTSREWSCNRAFREDGHLLEQQPEGGRWDAKRVAEALGFKPIAGEGLRKRITRRSCERFCRALSIAPHEIDGL